MASRSEPADLLVGHVEALRQLARRLTRDAHSAEDAVQDTLLAALSRLQRLAAEPPRAVRAWLGAILRNRVRERAREESRRAAREAVSAEALRPETAPPAVDVVAELALHRHIVELVRELDEPYRQTVFLRYFRGWSAREIASALSVSPKTVHTRLERALARLRARLDAEQRGRGAWLAALAAIVRPPAATALGGVLLMKTKVLWAAAVAVALLGVLPVLRMTESAPPDVPDTGNTAPAVTEPSIGGAASEVLARETVGFESVEAAPPTVESAAVELSGVVLDFDARPVADVRIVFVPSRDPRSRVRAPVAESGHVVSDADGRFTLPVPAQNGVLTSASDTWVAVKRPWVQGGRADESVELLVAPRRRYGGTVVDPRGHPIPGAEVVVVLEGDLPTRTVGDRVVALPSDFGTATTDEAGRFEFDDIGYLAGLSLSVSRHGFRGEGCALPPVSAADLRIELRPATDAQLVHGVVLDPEGRPVRGALVAAIATRGSGDAIESDGAGRFTVRLRRGERPERVSAVHREFGAVTALLGAEPGAPGSSAETPLLLQFPAEPAAVRGQVVDADGEPVAGARVWTPDLTYFGMVPYERHGQQFATDASVEGLAGGDHALSLATTSAADGSFELRGLMPRRYAWFALAPRDLAGAGPVFAAPGESVELRVLAPRPSKIAGRVVSRSGTPLPGVRVALGRRFEWQPPPREVEPWIGTGMRLPAAAHTFRDDALLTDAEGRFAFEPAAVDGTFLAFSGESLFLAPPFRLAEDLPLEDLEIVVDVRSGFHVELGGEAADAFSLCRSDGSHVPLFVRIDDAQMSLSRVPIVAGKSCAAYSFAGAVTLVLWNGEHEVRRVPVTLPEGEGHVVRP